MRAVLGNTAANSTKLEPLSVRLSPLARIKHPTEVVDRSRTRTLSSASLLLLDVESLSSATKRGRPVLLFDGTSKFLTRVNLELEPKPVGTASDTFGKTNLQTTEDAPAYGSIKPIAHTQWLLDAKRAPKLQESTIVVTTSVSRRTGSRFV